jgi:hypothetical protein
LTSNVGIDRVMAILIFVLSLVLLVAGAASGYQSLDLLPTSIGLLYALAGTVAVSAAVVTFAIAVLIRRIDRLARSAPQSAGRSILAPGFGVNPSAEAATPDEASAPPLTVEAERFGSADEAPGIDEESPINFNRSGHLPSLETVETEPEAPEEPQGPPSLIGSYSSAGANYKIFSDGSIEADTSEGAFKFASMTDFKRHLQERQSNREVGA